jgi:serine phosphatase RsbU (regulator of sigma subunit)/Tfp pilus assembly protein PilF
MLQTASVKADYAAVKDSLLKELETAKHDTVRARIYLNLSDKTLRDNVPEAIEFCLKSIELYEATNDKKGICLSYSLLGNAYGKEGNQAKATTALLKALSLAEQLKNQELRCDVYNNMGYLYLREFEYNRALEYFHKALDIQDTIQNKVEQANIYNNMGVTYKWIDSLDVAKDYYERAMNIRIKLGDEVGIAELYNNMALISVRKEQYDSAITYFEKSIELNEKLKNYYGLSAALGNLGRIYLIKKNYPKAISYGLTGIKTAEDHGYRAILRVTLSNLYSSYKGIGDTENAFKYFEIYHDLNEELNEEAQTKELAKLEASFKMEQQQLKIDNLNKEKKLDELENDQLKKKQKLSDLKIEQQRSQNIIIVGGLCLALILIIIVLIAFLQKRKSSKMIAAQRDRVQQQKDVIEEQRDIVEEKNREIVDSINYAKLLQDTLLPETTPFEKHFKDHFILYLPKDIVSGDFYWIGEPTNDAGQHLVVFAVGDCTGHGVPGALLTMMGQNYLHLSLTEDKVMSPGDALGYLDKGFQNLLRKKNGESVSGHGMDIAMCAIETNSLELQYAGARNPVVIIRDGELHELKGDKQGVGDHSDVEFRFTDHKFQLQKGDTIYLFSDGFVDQFGGLKGKKFKSKPFKDMLLSIYNKPSSEQKEIISSSFNEWKGDLEQVDDVCLIALQI